MAKAKAQDGKQVLDQWKASYFEVRARIEKSDRDSRWEFNRKKLFEKTDYMASICQDLYNILQVSQIRSSILNSIILHEEICPRKYSSQTVTFSQINMH